MKENKVYLYKGEPVFVTKFQPYPSNFVYFNKINHDGSLGEEGTAYNNGPFSSEPIAAEIITYTKVISPDSLKVLIGKGTGL